MEKTDEKWKWRKESKELYKPKIQYLNIHKSIEFLQQIRLVKHKIHVWKIKRDCQLRVRYINNANLKCRKKKNHQKKIGSLDACEIISKLATHMKLDI